MRGRLLGRATPAVVALLLAGCSGAAGGGPAASVQQPDTDGLTAVLSQLRSDTASRRFRVKLTQPDAGAAKLHVTRLAVTLPGFTGPSVSTRDSHTDPGGAVDLPVDLGEVDCADDPAGQVVTAEVTVEGVREPVRLDVPDPTDLVGLQHRRECAELGVTTSVPVDWASTWAPARLPDGRVVSRGELVVGPVAGDLPATVVELGSTVLLTPELAAGTLPLTVAPGATARVPVTLRPTRCDAHVVAEGLPHRGYQFVVRVGLGDAEPVPLTVPPRSQAVKDVMLDALLDECGLR